MRACDDDEKLAAAKYIGVGAHEDMDRRPRHQGVKGLLRQRMEVPYLCISTGTLPSLFVFICVCSFHSYVDGFFPCLVGRLSTESLFRC